MQGERYIGTHGPAIRDAAGWKLIVNGAGGAYAGKSWLLLCGVNFALYYIYGEIIILAALVLVLISSCSVV